MSSLGVLYTQCLDGKSTLGFAVDGKRKIKNGDEYNRFFGAPLRRNPILRAGTSPLDTIDRYMPQIIRQNFAQTAQLATQLKKSTLDATCRAIWQFVFDYIQYRRDAAVAEQIRTPNRTWADRKNGVDCDCYSVFISSILCNLNIPHSLRMASYNATRGYQHVYVVVPKSANANMSNRADYIVIDDVMDQYNDEKPFLKKYDHVIIAASANPAALNGLGDAGDNVGSDFCLSPIYYNSTLGTWAMQCTDGTWAIRGKRNNRVSNSLSGASDWVRTPLNLVDGELGWVAEALAVAKKAGGVIKNVVKKAKDNKAAKKAAKGAAKVSKQIDKEADNDINDYIAQQQSADTVSDVVKSLTTGLQASNNANTQNSAAVQQSVKASNHTVVTSLNTVNKQVQNKIDTAINSVKNQLDAAAQLEQNSVAQQTAQTNAMLALQTKYEELKQQGSMNTVIIGASAAALLISLIVKKR